MSEPEFYATHIKPINHFYFKFRLNRQKAKILKQCSSLLYV